ncbi:Lysine-specific demethylase REF6 [Acorus calamus]|uniref:Lysine-specific demethylase REF6 n=1 Tax=Acorus calamus TaxID=4465 RepID=A0AAV9F593_ACOCL|nr:Lysine-specific demethylase REF6 [Acorus calamus]
MGPPQTDPQHPDLLPWLKSLPHAPEYHPTPSEFKDPIAYILKIEKEASKYGICKIVPPLPPLPKKTTISNFNRSFAAFHDGPNKKNPTFATRQQQIGFCPRKNRPVQKPVWQSGESYTLQQFEAKARHFERTHLRKAVGKKAPSAMEIESLFWRANLDKPFSVEYANDMPGSGFPERTLCGGRLKGEDAGTVGESAWNMRGVSRAKGSLLRFMKEEIPGVTSPMIYVAMMFSWFAWHVEDHDLHSLNYLHHGAGKTWYGVPSDAGFAFEEVVRVHGYGGEVNPLGYNLGEAANIATPEWLKVAKAAAIRRASINYPPMVSHFQLLYALVVTLCASVPTGIDLEPRSSRLKEKKRGEGEQMVKELFVQNIIQNNCLLDALISKGSSCVLIPQNTFDISLCPSSRMRSRIKLKPRWSLGLCSREEAIEASKHLRCDALMTGKKAVSASSDNDDEKHSRISGDGLLDQGLLSCVTCGILSFACMAIVQPKEVAARYLMSADCTSLGDQTIDSDNGNVNYIRDSSSGQMMMHGFSGSNDILNHNGDHEIRAADQINKEVSGARRQKGISSLDLLATAYGNSSDSEEEPPRPEISNYSNENNFRGCSSSGFHNGSNGLADDVENGYQENLQGSSVNAEKSSLIKNRCSSSVLVDGLTPIGDSEGSIKDSGLAEVHNGDAKPEKTEIDFEYFPMSSPSNCIQNNSTYGQCFVPTQCHKTEAALTNSVMPTRRAADRDSSRLHVFCLEHALETEKHFHSIGGAHIMLLCHPDYTKIEELAKLLSEELDMDYEWKDINPKEPVEEDEERLRLALEDEEAIPSIRDWTVKLGINLFHSSNLSKSPLYSKQMPYNKVIYKAFGRSCSGNSPTKPSVGRKPGRQKKIVVAGKWCGKVWMSNQVHPYLTCLDEPEQEEPVLQSEPPHTDQTPKAEIKPSIITFSRRSGRKRRNPSVELSLKKQKSEEEEPFENSPVSGGRVLRSGLVKHGTPLLDESEGGPSTRLRARPVKPEGLKSKSDDVNPIEDEGLEYQCDVEGCTMSFGTKHDLVVHKKNICPVKGCGKKFFSHKYLVQHRRVHLDDRPLKCPWKGCKMSFKWAWARTEHIRVHTGARPYVCKESGCGQTFRFVSDFSRHKRKTGHSAKKKNRG